jgi:hypothetical protein
MQYHRFSRTSGSTIYEVDLYHATSVEDSVFGAGPVSLIHEVTIPRKGSRVKAKLQLNDVFSPAMVIDHDADQLAPVESSKLLSVNKVADIQSRVVASSENTHSLVNGGSCLSDKRERSLATSSFPPPPRNPRVLVCIRRDLFIARRFSAADCFPAREFERVPYVKSFSFAELERSSRWRQAEEVGFRSLVVGEVELGSRALRGIVSSKSPSLHKPRSLPKVY